MDTPLEFHQRIEDLRRRGWSQDDIDHLLARLRREFGNERIISVLLARQAPLPPVEASRGRVDDGVLAKVRGLLAKAESTDFLPEAGACTAKAQELITKYRINDAMVEAQSEDRDGVVARRFYIEDPYAEPKAVLLSRIARANGGAVLWQRHLRFATAFGAAHDLELIDVLFTSLLVQASVALQREGTKSDAWGRNRTRRFRQSFLIAFAVGIGDRLSAASETTVASAAESTGMSLVPVLFARRQRAEAAAERAAPDAGSFGPSESDLEGWEKGTAAASAAQLHANAVAG
jgi:hypothetical protein